MTSFGRGGGFTGRGGGGGFRGTNSRPNEDEGANAGGGSTFGRGGGNFGRGGGDAGGNDNDSGARGRGFGRQNSGGGDEQRDSGGQSFGRSGQNSFGGRGGGPRGGGGGRDFGDNNRDAGSDDTSSKPAGRGFQNAGRENNDSEVGAPRGHGFNKPSSAEGDEQRDGGGQGFGRGGGGNFGRGGGANFGKASSDRDTGGDDNRGGGGFGGRGGGFGGRGGGGGRDFGDNNRSGGRGGGDSGGGGRGGGACFKCNETGHFSRECPNGSTGGGGGSFGRRDDGERGGRGGGFGGRGGGARFGDGGGGGRDFGDDRGSRGGGRFGDRDGGSDQRLVDRDAAGTNDLFFRSNRVPREFETEEERLREQSHVPMQRTIEEIVQEDLHVADSYLQIREEDDNVAITGEQADPSTVLDKWADANFEPKLLENIERSKYVVPRKIQALAIPLIMDGLDIKGHSETGSGKSAAFLLPIISMIMKKKAAGEFKSKRSTPYALIIEPTRELCIQLYEQAKKLADNTEVTVAKAYGKYMFKQNLREISLGCDILIGTPGRLIQVLHEKYVVLDSLKIFVLDEADQLLDDQFARDLRQMEKIEGFPKKEDRQTLLFSATFSSEVQMWSGEWLRENNIMVSNKKPASANSRVRQEFIIVPQSEKTERLLKILKDEIAESKKLKAEQKEEQKENIEVNGDTAAEGVDGDAAAAASATTAAKDDEVDGELRRTLVFVRMKRNADVVAAYLANNQIKASTINSDRPQKLREETLNKFRKNEINVVIATDVCARGIDIKDLDHVINMDLPDEHITYVHRIGRTGRLKEGHATSFFDPIQDQDVNLLKELVRIVKEVDQLPPEFLVKASEGTLSYVKPNEYGFGKGADDATADAATGSDNDEGTPAAAPTAAAATEANDEWD